MLPFSAVIQYISAQDLSFSCQYVNLNLSASHAISVVCICVTWWCWILVPEKRKGKKKRLSVYVLSVLGTLLT